MLFLPMIEARQEYAKIMCDHEWQMADLQRDYSRKMMDLASDFSDNRQDLQEVLAYRLQASGFWGGWWLKK